MSRRTAPAKKTDDETFACRVRIIIPGGGLGEKLQAIQDMFRERFGRVWAMHAGERGIPDTAYLYSNDPVALAECVTALGLEIDARPKKTP
ncbi:MAG: hypothetical protein LCH46_07240 [Proteobacteria bacterium]|nr:hypothetical protein [Pseudomonadota bacterium]